MQLAQQLREFGDPTGNTPATIKDLEVVFNNVVYVALGLAGIVLLIMFFTGGFQMLTAGGEAPKVEAAKKTLTYAIIGLVLVTLSFFIIRFIANFTGIDITQFRITQPSPTP